MSMYAREFFAELGLPFTDGTVVGTTYYATPAPGTPLRLRIDFSRTIRADVYDGLRIATLHQDRGELDVVVLRFEDHKTFDHRDAARGRTAMQWGYGTIQEFQEYPDWVPWQGAHTRGLHDAIEQYTAIWFPGAWPAPAPSRAAGHTTHKTPAPPATRSGGHAR